VKYLEAAAIILGIGAIVGACVWWEARMWSECMTDHSFWYCLRVLGN